MRKHRYILNEIPEGDLLLEMKNDDEDAFVVIYKRYHAILYVLAHKYLKDDDSARNIVQSVFIKFWEIRRILPEKINLRNYLYTMAKNLILNEIRNKVSAMLKNKEIVSQRDIFEKDLIEIIDEKEKEKSIYQAIEKLPSQKKTICLYKMRGDMSNKEIAEKMNISVSTVKAHYSQALKMLQNFLEPFNLLIFLLFV